MVWTVERSGLPSPNSSVNAANRDEVTFDERLRLSDRALEMVRPRERYCFRITGS